MTILNVNHPCYICQGFPLHVQTVPLPRQRFFAGEEEAVYYN